MRISRPQQKRKLRSRKRRKKTRRKRNISGGHKKTYRKRRQRGSKLNERKTKYRTNLRLKGGG